MKKQHVSLFLSLLFLLALLSCGTGRRETITGDLAIIPLPVQMEVDTGFFVLDEKTWIQSDPFTNSSFDPVKIFTEVFSAKSGYPLFTRQESIKKDDEKHLILIIRSPVQGGKESYTLRISPVGIVIHAGDEAGIFYAFQTLRQIMRLDALPDASNQHRVWTLPAVNITDKPSFSYRGLHLDVCRHFMPVDFVKKYIDLLAYYKMNRFHWHLTDDQGWRIEIRQYPKLQEVAAWRAQTLIGHASDTEQTYNGTRYGGFYTQDEIRDIVQFAADRGVMVIPEIEMPGHALAALAAYPELSCTGGPFNVGETWGVFEDVFCPTEQTFTFLQHVLDEVITLFPSPYIHIGGDECPKKRWKENAYCQALMKKEGLKNEMELQSYFIQRMETYLNSQGKKIIGWDEIMEGGLAPNATVMSWRGMSGGIAASKQGHDVIMTPGTHCYFDHYQAELKDEPLAIGGLTTVEKVYAFDPIPDELTREESRFILGAQGNLWTEYISTPDRAEYMVYPRAMALAEVLWTPKPRRSWNSFVDRVKRQTDRLDGMQVHYARHILKPK